MKHEHLITLYKMHLGGLILLYGGVFLGDYFWS
jgi:hypothetical protein